MHPTLITLKDYAPANPIVIHAVMDFIRSNIDHHYEVTPQEHQTLVACFNANGIKYSILLELRQTVVVYQYMNCKETPVNIAKRFQTAVKLPDFDADVFYNSVMLCPFVVTKAIKKTKEYSEVSQDTRTALLKVTKTIKENDTNKIKKAMEFETKLSNVFIQLGIDFYTEKELREIGIKATPDIVFKEPLFVQLNGAIIELHWLDAKNYICIGKASTFLYRGLKTQAKKYNETYGEGGFVFADGYASDVLINDTWLFSGDSFGI